jgi:DNA-binding MarR family transcriptional regulator
MERNHNEDLYTALYRLGRQLHRCAHRLGQKQGYYREQSRLLLLIAENDGVIQRDLAMGMDVRPSSMTEMLARMEQLGLIRREQDEKDQRVMHIFLTEQGKEVAEESRKTSTQMAEKLFEGLTPEETDEMLRLTEKLTAHLDALDSAVSEGGTAHRHHRGFEGHHCFDGGHRHDRAWHHRECGEFGCGRFS